jgi:hypothetical protein
MPHNCLHVLESEEIAALKSNQLDWVIFLCNGSSWKEQATWWILDRWEDKM